MTQSAQEARTQRVEAGQDGQNPDAPENIDSTVAAGRRSTAGPNVARLVSGWIGVAESSNFATDPGRDFYDGKPSEPGPYEQNYNGQVPFTD